MTGDWSLQKHKLLAKFPALTEADLQFGNGKKVEMLERLQNKLGKTQNELALIINDL